MKVSFSNIEFFGNCPYKWKLHYIDGLKTIPNWDDASNPLLMGSAMHHGIQFGWEEGVKEYFTSYPIISDSHLDEALKMQILIPKVQDLINLGAEFELKLEDDSFIGFVDYYDRETKTLLDFKYTSDKNFQNKYLKSPQVHVYKHYMEKLLNLPVENLGYLQIPKIQPRQKKTETQMQFRQRLQDELTKLEPHIEYVEFSQKKVDKFFEDVELLEKKVEKFNKDLELLRKEGKDMSFESELTAKTFEKNVTGLCDWCEYKNFCNDKGDFDIMTLPKNERHEVLGVQHKKLWLYGAPFSGKTTLADKFPEPLMINTDGNVEFCTAPSIEIKDMVEDTGRVTNVVLAWDVFKDAVAELEKGSTFKTIVVDLVEDLYECCRLYMYKQMGITHESDDSFRAWDKVRTEFLSTMRKLTNLPYNIVLISHEDASKDITKRSGDKITSIRPNINEKVANKLAGMVDIVVRVTAIDGDYRLSFKADEVVFGGGRINPPKKEIPNDYGILMSVVYGEKSESAEATTGPATAEAAPVQESDPVEEKKVEEAPTEEPRKRTRRSRKENN